MDDTTLLVPASDEWASLAAAARDTLAQVSPGSRRQYTHDLKVFAFWMDAHGLVPGALTRSHMIEYQRHLLEDPRANGKRYARASAAKMIASVRSTLKEWSLATGRANPATGLKPIRLANESTHVALSKPRARQLLHTIDRSTLIGKRDYALVLLLLRTGIRRAEAADLTIGDLRQMDGHRVAIIQHGKEDKRRIVKLLPDVFRAIQSYMEAAYRLEAKPEEPLFVQVRRGNHAQKEGIGTKAIERIVKALAFSIDEEGLTPHGLRATYVTLALESGAPLEKVQFSAGHAKPETTLRYHKAKLNLEHNAADYLHDLA
jgi:site-specific recombinase XerD